MADTTTLDFTAQRLILGLGLEDYWWVRHEANTWLLDNCREQQDRITDTRLSEILPEGQSVVCKRCGLRTTRVPCIPCLAKTGVSVVIEDHETWGVASGSGVPRQPDEPTMFRPGSLEKIELMRQRFEDDCAVFHPDDISEREYDYLESQHGHDSLARSGGEQLSGLGTVSADEQGFDF